MSETLAFPCWLLLITPRNGACNNDISCNQLEAHAQIIGGKRPQRVFLATGGTFIQGSVGHSRPHTSMHTVAQPTSHHRSGEISGGDYKPQHGRTHSGGEEEREEEERHSTGACTHRQTRANTPSREPARAHQVEKHGFYGQTRAQSGTHTRTRGGEKGKHEKTHRDSRGEIGRIKNKENEKKGTHTREGRNVRVPFLPFLQP